ncbi:phosphotransferase enzyme family protein [Roseivirga misakiensis]|uniref:Aminoglycoside phosphotransferase domain-containing protein n=1 Tax=Roseivirga misakiensis TaxID=1563681 RepID=A0A1E5T5Q1_9BACT|nr:aminoglycoside phosphotransferase family protein [Roseivirga misakiensis]OEK06690.1 hypothetical protein BFP71_03230 [Roseivirga misakiensis]
MKAAKEAVKAFNIKGAVDEIALFGSGHINDTYRIRVGGDEYLLQRLNENVFTNAHYIEHNLDHLLRQKSSLFVDHFKTDGGAYHYRNESGLWRLTLFLADAYSPQTADSLAEVAAAAEGFGSFTAFTDTCQVDQFHEVIPRFHDLEWRLTQLDQALKSDLFGRCNEVRDFSSKVINNRAISNKMKALKADGLPVRLCHNDTKLNNSLLAKSDASFQKVIDLDTVGPGSVLYDFGDLMRTTVSNAAENESDTSKIQFRPEFFETLKENFLKTASPVLKNLEIEHLFFGGQYMTYMMAVRFLTDYINGDIYFKTTFQKENLVRAQNQMTLLEKMNAYEREIS